nr:nucleotide-binding alpha-beta plait domain-containing protein [Tanacetum cinerariifolium]
YRTKEDDVYKISTSVFITNFPESCSAKKLFQSCKQYGHVVDTFIPNKRSKTGRRFHRTSLNEKKSMPKKAGGVKNDIGVNDVGNSYVHMVKGQMKLGNKESEATPALDEMCFHPKRLCIYTKSEKNIFEEFKNIFRGRAFWMRAKEALGWVPDFMKENDDEEQ